MKVAVAMWCTSFHTSGASEGWHGLVDDVDGLLVTIQQGVREGTLFRDSPGPAFLPVSVPRLRGRGRC